MKQFSRKGSQPSAKVILSRIAVNLGWREVRHAVLHSATLSGNREKRKNAKHRPKRTPHLPNDDSRAFVLFCDISAQNSVLLSKRAVMIG